MAKKETSTTSSNETTSLAVEAPPKPPVGPTIVFKDIDVKSGGIVTVTCIDKKVPLNTIQILEIEAGGVKYTYRRI